MDKRFADIPSKLFDDAVDGFKKGEASNPLGNFLLGVAFGYRFKRDEQHNRIMAAMKDISQERIQRNRRRKKHALL